MVKISFNEISKLNLIGIWHTENFDKDNLFSVFFQMASDPTKKQHFIIAIFFF